MSAMLLAGSTIRFGWLILTGMIIICTTPYNGSYVVHIWVSFSQFSSLFSIGLSTIGACLASPIEFHTSSSHSLCVLSQSCYKNFVDLHSSQAPSNCVGDSIWFFGCILSTSLGLFGFLEC